MLINKHYTYTVTNHHENDMLNIKRHTGLHVTA